MKKAWMLLAVMVLLALIAGAGTCEEAAVFEPQGLPVVYLHLDGGQEAIDRMNESPDHSEKCTGSMDLVVPEAYGSGLGGMFPQRSVSGLQLDYIRGRGNGTWGMSKHPYRIKLQEKADLFGLGSNKHWILLGNYFDNSMMRNWLTAWLGDRMGLEFTPMGVFTEVVMNGEYLGCYYLCEQVRVGKTRVAIDELREEDASLPEIRGGYLLELFPDETDRYEVNAYETAKGVLFGFKSPSFDPEDGGYRNDAQKEYIRTALQRAEDALWADGPDSEGKTWEDCLDRRSAADYWWINEFSVNADAYTTDSSMMYKKRSEADGSDGKLYFGPLWDFDESWGNAQVKTRLDIGFNNTYSAWINQLRTKPGFLEYLKERWQVMDAWLEKIVQPDGILDQACAQIRDAWYRDEEKWRSAREEDGTSVGRSLEEETEHIRAWIGLRRDWINGNMDRLGLVTFTLTVRADGREKQYEIPCDTETDLSDLELPEKEGAEFTGWLMEDGTPAEDFLLMDRDIVLTAQFK